MFGARLCFKDLTCQAAQLKRRPARRHACGEPDALRYKAATRARRCAVTDTAQLGAQNEQLQLAALLQAWQLFHCATHRQRKTRQIWKTQSTFNTFRMKTSYINFARAERVREGETRQKLAVTHTEQNTAKMAAALVAA